MSTTVKVVLSLIFLMLLYAGYSTFMSKPEPVKQEVKAKPKTKPWFGNSLKPYNFTFTNKKTALQISSVRFSGLNKKIANAKVTISAVSYNKKTPHWLKKGNFYGMRPRAAVKYDPIIKSKINGSSLKAKLYFKGIPSGSFGPSCTDNSSQENDPFLLNIKALGFKKPIMLTINAFNAPAGHCFNEPSGEKKKKKKTVIKIYRIKHNRSKEIVIVGAVSKQAKKNDKVRVTVYGKGFKSSASPKLTHRVFKVKFKPSPGKYKVLAEYRKANTKKSFSIEKKKKKK